MIHRGTWNRRLRDGALALLALVAIEADAAPVYYVSPRGSDTNSGLSPDAAWRTAAQVNASTFDPGARILFERGGEWRERLIASSSGSVQAPIVYGAYGSGAKPKFWGSDLLDGRAFQPLAGAASTYTLSTPAQINSVLIDQQFTRWSRLLTNTEAPASNIAYVKANPNTWYHDGSKLYLNTGGVNPATDPRRYSAAVREDVVYSNAKDNLIFRDLVVDESARYGSGYAFRAQFSSNVQFIDSEAYRAGKHHFASINSTGFVARNLYSRYAMPDQGFGGASAYVAYSDLRRSNDSSEWINVTVEDPGGAYPAFVSHGEGLGAILLRNLVAKGGAGIHVAVESPDTRLRIIGGSVENAGVDIYGSGQYIDGLRVTGTNGSIALHGSNNTVQNVHLDGYAPFFYHGRNGAIVDFGGGNIIRYNRIRLDPQALAPRGAISVLNGVDGSEVYGNVFLDPDAFMIFQEGTNILSHDNVFVPDSRFTQLLASGGILIEDLAAWQSRGLDLDAIVGTGIWTRYQEPRFLPDDAATSIPEPQVMVAAALAGLALALRRVR